MYLNFTLWYNLSENPGAVSLINEDDLKEFDWRLWYILSGNPEAIPLLEKLENQENIDWTALSRNPNAISLLKDPENQKNIDWVALSRNPNPEAISLLENHLKNPKNSWYKLWIWDNLSENPNPKAISMLKQTENENNINWNILSGNPDPEAISLLEQPENQGKIDWRILSGNPEAISLLTENKDKIHWDVLSENPNAKKLIKEKFVLEQKIEQEKLKKELEELKNNNTIVFDPITQEEISIEHFNYKDFFLFKLGKLYYCFEKKYFRDDYKLVNNIFFACKEDTSYMGENVIYDREKDINFFDSENSIFNFTNIGIGAYYIYLKDLKKSLELSKDDDKKMVHIIIDSGKTVNSVVSYGVLFEGQDIVSSSHCTGGGGKVCKLHTIPAEYTTTTEQDKQLLPEPTPPEPTPEEEEYIPTNIQSVIRNEIPNRRSRIREMSRRISRGISRGISNGYNGISNSVNNLSRRISNSVNNLSRRRVVPFN